MKKSSLLIDKYHAQKTPFFVSLGPLVRGSVLYITDHFIWLELVTIITQGSTCTMIGNYHNVITHGSTMVGYSCTNNIFL